MSQKSYETYKDSGVEWMGDIPKHWRTKKLKNIADVYLSNVDKKTTEGEKKINLCNYVDVYYNDEITDDIEFMLATAKSEQIKKFTLQKHDVLITKDSESPTDIAVPTWVSKNFKDVLCGYHLALIRPTKKINGKYLFFTLMSESIRSQYYSRANGVTRFGLGKEAIKNGIFPVPTIEEQIKITDFLEQKSFEIKKIVNVKKQQIETLKNYRQSLISEIVTRGLNPTTDMKDSGVEWIGPMPEHWEVKKIKHFTNHIGSGKTPKGGSEVYVNEGVLFIRSQNIYNDSIRLDEATYITEEINKGMSSSRVNKNDLLLNITGASIGRSSIYKLDKAANVNQHVCIIRIGNKEILPEYLHYVLINNQIQSQIMAFQNGTSREGLNFVQIANLTFAYPKDVKEQTEIISFLNQKTVEIDSVIKSILHQIDTLEKYRQSLIFEAVTGKIDVRNYKESDLEVKI